MRIRNRYNRVVESRTNMCYSVSIFFRSRRFVRITFLRFAIVSSTSFTYFFLLATVRRGPLRVRAFVLVVLTTNW